MSEFEHAFKKVMESLPEHFRTEDGFRWGNMFFRMKNGNLQKKTPQSQQEWMDSPREAANVLASVAFSLGVEDCAYYAKAWLKSREFYDVHRRHRELERRPAPIEMDDWERASHDGTVRMTCKLQSVNFLAFDSETCLAAWSFGAPNGRSPNAATILQSERERILLLHPPAGFLGELVLPDSMCPSTNHLTKTGYE